MKRHPRVQDAAAVNHRSPGRRRAWSLYLRSIGLAVVLAQAPVTLLSTAAAMQLSGILMQGIGADGNLVGPLWHTATHSAGRPIGFTRWALPGIRWIPFANSGTGGEINVHLYFDCHDITLFWQFGPWEFPPSMLLNLYFNGDYVEPGISAVVSSARGFTHFQPNTQATTLSLYGRDVDNVGSLFFDDGQTTAHLAVAFYMPASGGTDQWRPSDLVGIDRVGVNSLTPDGHPDGVMIIELITEPSLAPRRPASPAAPHDAGVQGPLTAEVGADQWRVPPTAPLPVAPPTPMSGTEPPSTAGETASATEGESTSTPAPEIPGAESTHTPATTNTPGRSHATPSPAEGSTPATQSTPSSESS